MLYKLASELIALEEQLEELTSDTDRQDLIDGFLTNWVEVQEGLRSKIDGYCSLIEEIEARAIARQEAARRLTTLATVDLNKVKSLKASLQRFFELRQIKKLDTDRYRLTLAKNGGKLAVILDSRPVENLPEGFKKTHIAADNEAIRKALESGEVLDFARLGDRGQSLRIK